MQQSDEKTFKEQDDVKNTKVNDTPKEIPSKSTLKTPNTQRTEQTSGNNTKTYKSEPKYESKTNVNATAKMEKAKGHALKPKFVQNYNDTIKNRTTGVDVAQTLLDTQKNFNQTLTTNDQRGSLKETFSEKETNDEKVLETDNVQKAIGIVKPNDSLKEIPKKSTPKMSNSKETENGLNKNTKINKNELKYESETNANATTKMEEAMGLGTKTNFDQNHNDTDKNWPTGEEEAENISLNLSDVPKNFNHTVATKTPSGSQRKTSARRKENDEKELDMDNVQKAIKHQYVEYRGTLKGIPKESTLETSTPNQNENKRDKNTNTKTNKSEANYECKTNANAIAKVEEAMGHPDFGQNQNNTNKNQPKIKEEVEIATQNLSENPKNLNQTLAAHSSTGSPKETSSEMEINDQAEFAYVHNLSYNKGDGNAFCRLCNARLPAPLKSMKEHVNGTNHRNKAKLKMVNSTKNKYVYVTIPTNKFVQRIFEFSAYGREHVILNHNIYLTMRSFSMITQNLNRLRCQVCEVNVADENDDHEESRTHVIAVGNTPVVQQLNGEFVREVSKGVTTTLKNNNNCINLENDFVREIGMKIK